MGKRNTPILRQSLLGTVLLGRTAVLGQPHFLEGPDLPTEGESLESLFLRQFGASYFSTSDAAPVGVAPAGTAPAVFVSLVPLRVQVEGRYEGGLSTFRLISSGNGN